MQEEYNLVSDGEFSDELVKGLRNRFMEQKFLYLNKGADLYYDIKGRDSFYTDEEFSPATLFEMGIKNSIPKDKKSVLISLGCGNAGLDTSLLKFTSADYKMDYIGVDSSRRMLDFAMGNMKEHNNISQTFLCADFSTNTFRRELSHMTEKYSDRLFVFFSNTFGNINQTNIIDILYNLLNKGEKIWLDVRLRHGIKAKDDLKILDIYSKYIDNDQENIKFFHNALNNIGVPLENGKLAISTSEVKGLGALAISINFQFHKKTKINVKGEDITILPDEESPLLQIYAYDPDGLINFFEGHGFNLVKVKKGKTRGFFIFEKN